MDPSAMRTRHRALRLGVPVAIILIAAGVVAGVRLTSSATPPPLAMDDFTCASTTFCVGLSGNGNPPGTFWSWDGTHWTAMASGSSIASDSNGFVNAIMCTSRSSCLAVGDQRCPIGCHYSERALVIEWDGSQWEGSTAAAPPGTASELDALSCPTPMDCYAVGATSQGALIERWDGAHWHVMSNPLEVLSLSGGLVAGEGGQALGSISCPTNSFCAAVGSMGDLSGSSVLSRLLAGRVVSTPRGTSPASLTVTETWNGSTWRASAAPVPASVAPSGFTQVACASPQWCLATTDGQGGQGGAVATDTWNGTLWEPGGAPPGIGSDEVPAVSCAGGTCMAVFLGQLQVDNVAYVDTSALKVAIWSNDSWHGEQGLTPSRWQYGPIAPAWIASQRPTMVVSCVSAGACVMKGWEGTFETCSASQGYLGVWTGDRWSVSLSPKVKPPVDCR